MSRAVQAITITAGFLLAGLIGVGVWTILRADQTYRYALTRQALTEIAESLCSYHSKHGAFPAGFQISDLGNPRFARPEDNWGYVSQISPHAFTLTSYARDGKPGGQDHDQDIIVSWKAGEGLTVQSADISP